MKGIAYSELKKDKRAYEIMTLRDQNGDTFTDIAKKFMISSSRARQIYNKHKLKQIGLYISHIAEVHNDDSQVRRVYESAENCYRNHTYACAYLEKEYRDILDEYREGEPGMPKKFIKSIPPLKTTHKEKTLSRIAEMREAEKASFAKIGKEMRMTPERVKYVYDCYRSVKGHYIF